MTDRTTIAFVLYDGGTPLDLIGPLQVLCGRVLMSSSCRGVAYRPSGSSPTTPCWTTCVQRPRGSSPTRTRPAWCSWASEYDPQPPLGGIDWDSVDRDVLAPVVKQGVAEALGHRPDLLERLAQ